MTPTAIQNRSMGVVSPAPAVAQSANALAPRSAAPHPPVRLRTALGAVGSRGGAAISEGGRVGPGGQAP
jgi:hypothetical protein